MSFRGREKMENLENRLDEEKKRGNGYEIGERIRRNGKQWIKEAGEILQYAVDDSNFNINNWKKDVRAKRKEYRKQNYDFLVSKKHGRFVSKMLSGVAVFPMDEKVKRPLEYIVAYAVGGLPETYIDILCDMFRLDKDRVIEANIVTEYFIKAPTSGIEMYIALKAGKFALDFVGINSDDVNPYLGAASFILMREAWNKYRQYRWEKDKKYVMNMLPMLNASAWTYYGPLFLAEGLRSVEEHFKEMGEVRSYMKDNDARILFLKEPTGP